MSNKQRRAGKRKGEMSDAYRPDLSKLDMNAEWVANAALTVENERLDARLALAEKALKYVRFLTTLAGAYPMLPDNVNKCRIATEEALAVIRKC